jgi:hypothetical protein
MQGACVCVLQCSCTGTVWLLTALPPCTHTPSHHNAWQVQQQAATQEAFELHNMVSNRLARWEAESAALAALHAKEQCAFDKRAESALLAARMTEQQELKRHCRRHRVRVCQAQLSACARVCQSASSL